MAIAQFPNFVIDCPDAQSLADFYATMLGWNVKPDEGWVEIRPEDGNNCISFQQVEDYRAPQWPAQTVPQQMHLDVRVLDLDEAEAAVIELGATKTEVHDLPRLPRSGRSSVLSL